MSANPETFDSRGNDPGDWYNIVEVESACVSLAAAYPALASLITLPNPTSEGRVSHALRIGAGASTPGRPALIVIGCQHGCEWGSGEIVLNLAADLLGAYAQQVDLVYGGGVVFAAADLTALLQSVDIVLFPLVNPDGLLHSRTQEPYWRKNRRVLSGPEQSPVIGVDLNRNYDFLFDAEVAFAPGSGVSSSGVAGDDVYRGPQPFSEPETRNVRWLVEQFPGLRWFVDLHSGASAVIHPWSDDESQSGDATMNFANPQHDGQRGRRGDAYREYFDTHDAAELARLAGAFAATAHAVYGADYGVGPGFDLVPAAGTSHDWVYARHRVDPRAGKTLAFAVEWYGEGYWPTWTRMLQIMEEVSAGLIALLLAARNPPPP